MPVKKSSIDKALAAMMAHSDHLTNNKEDYYRIPESKLRELMQTYNKDRAILFTWDDKHEKFDVNCINMEIDDKVVDRILKISKIIKK